MNKFPGGKGAGMPYYEVPEQVVEDPFVLSVWAQKAIDAATEKIVQVLPSSANEFGRY